MKKNSEYYTPNKIYTHKSILYTCKFIGYQGNKPTYEIVTTNEISGFKVGDKFTPNDPEKWFDITDTFIPPTPVKETEPEQPYYKGKGEHSVNQLEAICSQYKEYVSFLNSRGNDTTPTSKEGLEDGFTKGDWIIEETPNDGDTSHIICSADKETTIAGIYKWPVEDYDKEAEANARLIVEAKNMYQNLEWIVDFLNKGENITIYSDSPAHKDLKAILTRINKH